MNRAGTPKGDRSARPARQGQIKRLKTDAGTGVCVVLALACACALAPRPATAGTVAAAAPAFDKDFVKNGTLTPVIAYKLTASAGTHTVETRALDQGDTLLTVADAQGRTVGQNDDRAKALKGESPLSSQVAFTAAGDGRYLVLVTSRANGLGGHCDLLVDGKVVAKHREFGGYHVHWPWAKGDVFQTAHLPFGAAAAATVIAALDGPTLSGFAADGGIAGNARLVCAAGSRFLAAEIVVGSASESAADKGLVRIVRNNLGSSGDRDGDGLSDDLETHAPADLGLKADSADSDGDGLPDDWELLGVATPYGDVDLPAYGANPGVRQVFVEFDMMKGPPGKPQDYFSISDKALSLLRAAYKAAGIEVIADTGNLGQAPNRGGNLIEYQKAFDHNSTTPRNLEKLIHDPKYFSPARHFIFIYAVIASNFTNPYVGGLETRTFYPDMGFRVHTQYDLQPMFFTCIEQAWFVPPFQADVIAHELGHGLSLGHGGFEELNGKPNYVSPMNYLFAYSGIDTSRAPVFSDGHRAPMKEDAVDESKGIGPVSDYIYNIVAGQFAHRHGRASASSPDAIDFNADGRVTPGTVRISVDGTPGAARPLKDNDDARRMQTMGFTWTAWAQGCTGYRSFHPTSPALGAH